MSGLLDSGMRWVEARLGGTLGPLLVSMLGLMVVAFLVRVYAPERRRYLRISLIFWLLYAMALASVGLASWMGLASYADRVRAVGLFFLEAQAINLVAVALFFLVLPRTKIDIPDILRDLIVGTAYTVAILSLLRSFGVEVWSLLATSAVVSILVGVSLQPTLASIFGGVALQLDGSVREGDWVRLPDKQEGKVREIRWRHTLIETRNGDTLVLPNAQLLQQQLLVLGRREGQRAQHRMWVYFNVEARHSPDSIVELVTDALQGVSLETVATNPRPDCICLSLASSAETGAIQYAVRYWLLDLQKDDPTSSQIALRVYNALSRAGIPMAMPQRRLAMFKEGIKAQSAERREEFTRRVELLSRVELFEKLLPDELESLAPKLRPAPFCKGEVVTRQGAEAHWLYILVSGTAESRVQLPSGAERRIGEMHAPDIFGEFGLLTGAPRRETVVAMSRVECLRLDKADLRELIVRRPEIAEELSQKLAERQQRFDMTLTNMGETPLPPPTNARGHLLDTIQRFFGLDDEGPPSRIKR